MEILHVAFLGSLLLLLVIAGFRLQIHPFFRQWWWGSANMHKIKSEFSREDEMSHVIGTLNRRQSVYDSSLRGQDPQFMYNDGFHNITDFYKPHSYRDMVNATGLSQFLQTTAGMPTRYVLINVICDDERIMDF